MDWEDWLRKAAQRPSAHEDDKRRRTEAEIRSTLAAHEPLRGRDYVVYTKGSYANNTNVRLNFDVDIAVEYQGYFLYDLDFELKGKPKEMVNIVDSTDPYTRDEFKADIKAALVAAYGARAIEVGRIAYRVRSGKTTLPADVVPCWEYRRYDRISNGTPVYHVGSSVFPTGGSRTDNYPRIQQLNGTNKNLATNRRYKRMVRALKKLQTRLVSQGILDEELPSYLIECLVFNVPNESFGHDTYFADMRAVLAAIYNATLDSGNWNDWEEVHRLHYLFRGHKWSRTDVHNLAHYGWEHLGLE